MAEPVVLINVFEVSAGSEQSFIEWWKQSSEVLQHEPGFIDARLHQSRQPGARFRFINVAHWKTGEALDQARTRHQPILGSLTGGKGIPALYEVAAEYGVGSSSLPIGEEIWGND